MNQPGAWFQDGLRWWQERPAAIQLTVYYVAILLCLSVLFSAVFYHFAVGQLQRGLEHQYHQFEALPYGAYGAPPQFDPANPAIPYQANLAAGRHNLLFSLVYFNFSIVVLGSALCYWLAKRTVRPIEEALEAQSRFAADASHELRTPLAVMQTEIEIARSDPKLSRDEALQLLDSNLEEVKKLNRLADGLLHLARSEHTAIELTPVDLGDVIKIASDRVEVLARNADISIVNDASSTVVLTDAGVLVELLVILLDNAVKYSPARSMVTIRTTKHGDSVTLAVTDEGRGIAAHELPRIFERFYRADKSRTGQDVSGHGLGLSIARELARLLRTDLRVETELGAGTTFRFDLSSGDAHPPT